MPSERRPKQGIIREITGIPQADWLGIAGRKFREGISRAFQASEEKDVEQEVTNGHSHGASVNTTDFGINLRIQQEISRFNKEEEQKAQAIILRRLGAETNVIEAEARSIQLDNTLKEITLFNALKEAGVTAYFVNGHLTIFPLDPSATPPDSGSRTGRRTDILEETE